MNLGFLLVAVAVLGWVDCRPRKVEAEEMILEEIREFLLARQGGSTKEQKTNNVHEGYQTIKRHGDQDEPLNNEAGGENQSNEQIADDGIDQSNKGCRNRRIDDIFKLAKDMVKLIKELEKDAPPTYFSADSERNDDWSTTDETTALKDLTTMDATIDGSTTEYTIRDATTTTD